ncbi:MAG TPA: hypothetical protein VHN14_08475 [Kofleriaceae bacterium]|nr:hypothetical protein [Kofleriaceae bacterium]
MQLENKLVDGREAAHAESQQRADVVAHGEDTLPAPMVEAMHDAAIERRSQLLGAIRMILHRQTLVVSQLHLPARESRALDALQVAVSGRSHDLETFVYATDRRDMLEQALAVLQPDMIHTDDKTAHELHAQFADLAERVGELRHALASLEDAQDELLESRQKAALEQGATDPSEPSDPSNKTDKPRPTPTPGDPDAPRPTTTLTGPERPEPARPPSMLTGPELPAPLPPPSMLTGPERPEPARSPTTLTGPALPAPRSPPSTLTGPELPPEPPPVSSLGDAEEIAAKEKQPWWRRPFG